MQKQGDYSWFGQKVITLGLVNRWLGKKGRGFLVLVKARG